MIDTTATDSQGTAAPNHLDRRAALRAALGGAAAAVVLTAPAISSFSFAPAYAAAASGTPVCTTVVGPIAATRDIVTIGSVGKCLGIPMGKLCNTSSPVHVALGGGIDVYQVFGGLVDSGQGSLQVTYTGLTAGESCTVTLDGNCGSVSTTVTHPAAVGNISLIRCNAANVAKLTYSCITC